MLGKNLYDTLSIDIQKRTASKEYLKNASNGPMTSPLFMWPDPVCHDTAHVSFLSPGDRTRVARYDRRANAVFMGFL